MTAHDRPANLNVQGADHDLVIVGSGGAAFAASIRATTLGARWRSWSAAR